MTSQMPGAGMSFPGGSMPGMGMGMGGTMGGSMPSMNGGGNFGGNRSNGSMRMPGGF